MSRTNLNPDVWGASCWTTMYAFARGFPDKNPSQSERTRYNDFVKSVAYLLPCESCRVEFMRTLTKHPVWEHTNNSEMLCNWVVDRRNEVASRLGKLPIEYKDAENYFFRYYLRSTSPERAFIEEAKTPHTSISCSVSPPSDRIKFCAIIVLVTIVFILAIVIITRKCKKKHV